MILAYSGGSSPESTGPQGAKASAGERLPSNDGTYVRYGHPPLGDAAAALPRIRERLELAAIAAGSHRPEQVAAALLSKGVGL